ncbi:MAG: peptide-methionine (R)-S-oxide reductase MsrB [Verrucomicrobia bacterium]|nr:peptide-methionine (R)-S-oxide reductase MsrB [Verrucomicrobiota bacterium]
MGERVERSDSEWREQLGRERYNVMRRKATEGAFLGLYVLTQREGIYHCAGCSLALFSSKDKYQAGVGWPTFTQPVGPKNVYYLEDWSLGFKRYEVLCRCCDAHLGHVFNDGPPPKNLRYCINSISLTLK